MDPSTPRPGNPPPRPGTPAASSAPAAPAAYGPVAQPGLPLHDPMAQPGEWQERLNRWTQVRRPGYPPFWVGPTLASLVLGVGFLLGLGLSARNGSAGLAGFVAFLGLWVAIASTVLLFDRMPALGLGILAGLGMFAFFLGTAPLIEGWLALLVLLFGAAAYGRGATMVLSGLALFGVPVAVVSLRVVAQYGLDVVWANVTTAGTGQTLGLVLEKFMSAGQGLVMVGGPLVIAWACGLAMRAVVRSRQARAHAEVARDEATRDATYAQEVADLRAGQAQLARDVHDVVGHSLAVILAQAQSAQYLGDDEVDKMRETLGHVADSARRSLGDVRGVLAGTRDPRTATPTDGLGSLISGVRAAGNEVVDRIDGTPRPLPPEIDQVAYRVLQEMLTNALKHGRAGGPVWVRQIWPPDSPHALILEVHNLIQARPVPVTHEGGGIGLESMRHRLESIGGRLALDSIPTSEGVMYAATATLPLRAAEVEGD